MVVDELPKSAVAGAAAPSRDRCRFRRRRSGLARCAPTAVYGGEVELDEVPRNADQTHRGRRRIRRPGAPYSEAVSTHASDDSETRDLELPVEELLRRARPLPPHDEMVIEDLTEEEGAAFLEAVES
jgi:hypothetical protein